jgi:hypothetical protein
MNYNEGFNTNMTDKEIEGVAVKGLSHRKASPAEEGGGAQRRVQEKGRETEAHQEKGCEKEGREEEVGHQHRRQRRIGSRKLRPINQLSSV